MDLVTVGPTPAPGLRLCFSRPPLLPTFSGRLLEAGPHWVCDQEDPVCVGGVRSGPRGSWTSLALQTLWPPRRGQASLCPWLSGVTRRPQLLRALAAWGQGGPPQSWGGKGQARGRSRPGMPRSLPEGRADAGRRHSGVFLTRRRMTTFRTASTPSSRTSWFLTERSECACWGPVTGAERTLGVGAKAFLATADTWPQWAGKPDSRLLRSPSSSPGGGCEGGPCADLWGGAPQHLKGQAFWAFSTKGRVSGQTLAHRPG